MLPASRTDSAGCAIPAFDLTPSDVEGWLEELWAFQSNLHDGFPRSETCAHFFDDRVGQLRPLARKSIEPMALHVQGGTIRGGGATGEVTVGAGSACSHAAQGGLWVRPANGFAARER